MEDVANKDKDIQAQRRQQEARDLDEAHKLQQRRAAAKSAAELKATDAAINRETARRLERDERQRQDPTSA